MTQWQPTWICLLLTCIAVLSACASNDPTAPPPLPDDAPSRSSKLPKLNDPRFRHELNLPDEAMAKHQPIALMLMRLEIPFGQSMTPAWDTLPEPDLGDERWTANGLQLGRTQLAKLKDFYAVMPAPANVLKSRLIIASNVATFETTPVVRKSEIIMVREEGMPLAYGFSGGQFQFVIHVNKVEDGKVQMSLIPHHHKAKTHPLPLSPEEKMLEGTLFKKLEQSFEMDSNDVIVLAMTQPNLFAAPVEEKDATTLQPTDDASLTDSNNDDVNAKDAGKTSDADTLDENEEPAPQQPTTLRVPNHLGRLLLMNSGNYGALQMVIMIRQMPVATVDAGE